VFFFLLILEQSATFTWHVIKSLFFLNWGGECLLRGTPWVFILDRIRFVFKGLMYFETDGYQPTVQRLYQDTGVFLTADAPKCVTEHATHHHSLSFNSQCSMKPCELSLPSYYSSVQFSVSCLRTAHSSLLEHKRNLSESRLQRWQTSSTDSAEQWRHEIIFMKHLEGNK
jgi:hypothetical protein